MRVAGDDGVLEGPLYLAKGVDDGIGALDDQFLALPGVGVGRTAQDRREPGLAAGEADGERLSRLSTVYPFVFADHVLLMNESQRGQQDEICRQLAPLMELIELPEPFARIQAAIEEAHRNALGESQHRQAG